MVLRRRALDHTAVFQSHFERRSVFRADRYENPVDSHLPRTVES